MTSSTFARANIPWHQRLGPRTLIGVALIATLALAAVLVATSEVVTRYSLTRSNDEFLAARTAFDQLVASRIRFASKQTKLIVELPLFRAHLDVRDRATVEEMTDHYCLLLEANFCLVTDRSGELIGGGAHRTGAGFEPLRPIIQRARLGHSASEIVTLPEGLFLVNAEPAVFGQEAEVLGTFTAAYRLDDAVASELAGAAHCQVTFVCEGGVICGSSLPAGPRAALAGLLHDNRGALGAVAAPPDRHVIGEEQYVGGVYALTPGRPSGTLILLQDWAPTAQALHQIDIRLFGIGALVLGLAMCAALVFGRRITRPLRQLADTADDIAKGNWTRRVPVEGPAEAKTMAEAFNHMAGTLSHWHHEARSQSEQVQDAYERFRAVTDSANDAIVSMNGRGEIVFWNLRAEAVFGYAQDEALGQPITLLMPDRYRPEYADEMGRLMAGESAWVGRTIELTALRRDGGEVPVELSVSTFRAGQERFYTVVIRDITERAQAAEALRQREDQLRQAQKMEAIGRLAGGIAHDFNNVLTAILGYSELVAQELPEHSASRSDVEEIRKAARSAAALIRELLAFGRKQVLQPVVLDLNVVVTETENLLRRLIGEHIILELTLAPRLAFVLADRSQLEQVLLNLAVNARDAMPSGGRLQIRTSVVPASAIAVEEGAALPTGFHVLLSVTDSGQGMTDAVRARIFEPFFTTKAIGQGTGLGLATVYGIVSQSGGYVWVESSPGHGATFHVSLPVVQAAHSLVQDVLLPAEVVQDGWETVLLVEDNASVRGLAREMLTRKGYRVLEAANGEQGLQLATAHLESLSLVVTDVVMPVMGGRELVGHLLALRPDLKIIFTSGYTEDLTVRKEGAERGRAFLQKPFAPAALGKVVRQVLDGLETA